MSDIIRTLKDLIATCRDSEEGFGKAAKGVHDDNLRTRFVAIEKQRSDFADELAGARQEIYGGPGRIRSPERNSAPRLAGIGGEAFDRRRTRRF